MKRLKVVIVALCAIVGISSAFTPRHRSRQSNTRTYGVLALQGSTYAVLLLGRNDKCTMQANSTCTVEIQDYGTTYTSIPETDIVPGSKEVDAKFIVGDDE
jgi:Family of unknown function (DUF6520)